MQYVKRGLIKMVIFHGTSSIISGKLSYKNIGKNGTSKGYGFYFTTSRIEAETYATKESPSGFVYSAIFHGSKELKLYSRTMTRNDIIRLYTVLSDLVLLNYDSVIEAVDLDNEMESDSDIVNGLIQACGGSSISERILTTLHNVLGYDYSMDPLKNGTVHYVALVPSAYDLSIAYKHTR